MLATKLLLAGKVANIVASAIYYAYVNNLLHIYFLLLITTI